MFSLTVLYAGISEKFGELWSLRAKEYAPYVIQYAFGGLLSGMLIFYGRSGSLFESWPFLLIIIAVIYGNEIIRDRASRLIFNIAMLTIGILSYVVLVVPVITGLIGEWVFVGSSVLAVGIMYVFIYMLQHIVPRFIEIQKRAIIFTVGFIFIVFQFLYFTNIIPPIPLSLKEVGIYHSVVRFENGEYQLKYEEGTWWQFWKRSDTTFHPVAGGDIFCFALVFTPTRLHTDIYHVWDYYDASQKEWIEHARLSYPIFGGRDDGYRGYTLISNYRDGKWRCSVETERGQVLGREGFTVNSTEPHEELITRTSQ